MKNTELEKTEDVITDISEETLLSLDENLELDQENTEIAEGKCKTEEEDEEEMEEEDEEEMSEAKKVQEAEVSSDEEFMEYAKSILKAAHGDKYDEDKAMKTMEGILKKADGDYGAAVGMLTSGLGEEMEELDEAISWDLIQSMYVKDLIDYVVLPFAAAGVAFGVLGIAKAKQKIKNWFADKKDAEDAKQLAKLIKDAIEKIKKDSKAQDMIAQINANPYDKTGSNTERNKLIKPYKAHLKAILSDEQYEVLDDIYFSSLKEESEEMDEAISWDLIQSMYIKDIIDYVVVPLAVAGAAVGVGGVIVAKQKIKNWFAGRKDAENAKILGKLIKDAIEKIKKDSKAQDMIAQINAVPYKRRGDNTERTKLIKPYKAHLKSILSDEQYEVLDDIYFASLKEESEEMDDIEKDMKEDTQSEITVDSSDISRLVESEAGLTEEFKEKATTIFEAAVKSKVKEAEEALKESYAVTLIEEVETIKEGMVDKIDNYLTYAVECWVEDNKVAIESSLRTEIAENFIKSLKGVFAENYIEVPEGKVDLYAKLEEEKAAAETKLAESLELVSGLVESVENLSREKIITECTSDLADTQAEKLKSLIEDVQYSSEEKFRSKVETIKEFYINGPLFDSESKTVNEEVEDLTHSFITTETIVEDEGEAHVSPAMKNYLTAISRLNKATTANI
jgi:hypothetical protein